MVEVPRKVRFVETAASLLSLKQEVIMGHRPLPTIKVSVILTPNIDIRIKRRDRSASKSEIVGNCRSR
eukprot:14811171-Heterocapsa_arctica.AAC.1